MISWVADAHPGFLGGSGTIANFRQSANWGFQQYEHLSCRLFTLALTRKECINTKGELQCVAILCMWICRTLVNLCSPFWRRWGFAPTIVLWEVDAYHAAGQRAVGVYTRQFPTVICVEALLVQDLFVFFLLHYCFLRLCPLEDLLKIQLPVSFQNLIFFRHNPRSKLSVFIEDSPTIPTLFLDVDCSLRYFRLVNYYIFDMLSCIALIWTTALHVRYIYVFYGTKTIDFAYRRFAIKRFTFVTFGRLSHVIPWVI